MSDGIVIPRTKSDELTQPMRSVDHRCVRQDGPPPVPEQCDLILNEKEEDVENLDDLLDFYDELPTLSCGENGCNSCGVAFRMACATLVPGPKKKERDTAWDEDTLPSAPAFLANFDDDYIADPSLVDIGGEG